MKRVLLIILLGVIVNGCAPRNERHPVLSACPATLRLTWKNYDVARDADPESAIYMLDDVQIGKGAAGFRSLLGALGSRLPGSSLLIYPETGVLKMSGTGGESCMFKPISSPFARSKVQLNALKQLATEKDIQIWYLAGPPGEYVVGSTGEDLKMAGNQIKNRRAGDGLKDVRQ